MRTKTLLCAAALAAGALTSMAQVYSANVVGYVNVNMPGNGGTLTMLCNPMTNPATGDNISTLFANNARDGDTIYVWNAAITDFAASTPIYSGFSHTWNSTFNLDPGQAIFYFNNQGSGGYDNNGGETVTFVGQVFQGSVARTMSGPGLLTAVGPMAPVGGSFLNAIAGLTAQDGDTIYFWDVAIQDLNPVTPIYSGFSHTWSNVTSPACTNAPGIGFFYFNNQGANENWTYSFTVQ